MRYLVITRTILTTTIILTTTLLSSPSNALINYTCDLEVDYSGDWMRNNCVLDVYGEILTDGPVDYEELITLYNDTYGNYYDGSTSGYQQLSTSDVAGLGLNDISGVTSTFLSSSSSSGNPTYGAINSWEINYTWSADTYAYSLINWTPLCIQGEVEITTYTPNPPGGGPSQINTWTYDYIPGECKNFFGL